MDHLSPVSDTVIAQSVPDTSSNQPTDTSFQKTQSSSSSKKTWVMVLTTVLVVVVLGGSSYFIASMLNTPIKIKEAINTTEPLVESLDGTKTKIVDHLNKDMEIDSDSIDRYVQEGDNNVRSLTNDLDALSGLADKMTLNDLKDYRERLLKYTSLLTQLLDLEKENVRLAKLYKEPFKNYQDLIVLMSGASPYMYSDSKKYLSMVDEVIQKEEEVLKIYKSIQPNATFSSMHDTFIKYMEIEIDFIKKTREAVKKQSQSQIADAQKEFTESNVKLQTESSKASDAFDNTIRTLSDDLNDEYKKIISQIDSFKRKYNF